MAPERARAFGARSAAPLARVSDRRQGLGLVLGPGIVFTDDVGDARTFADASPVAVRAQFKAAWG
eukprot:6763763-Lingulodinium_polyedra.AAC.1